MAQACYVPRYLPASFKGVSFEATEAESDHGRRGAEGEFPFGEHTAYADLGRRIRTYRVTARFIRNSHVADANRLIRACESPGPGLLVHPTRGAVRAACKSISVKDDLIDGQGKTTADLEFVEANDFVTGLLSTALSVLGITPIVGAVGTVLNAAWAATATAAYFDVPAALGLSGGLIDHIRGRAIASAGFTTDPTLWSALAEMSSLSASPEALKDPAKVWTAVAGGFAAIETFGATRDDRWQALRSIANWTAAQRIPSGTVKAPCEALIATARILAAVHMAKLAIEAPGATMQAALGQFDTVMALLDDELRIAKAACDTALWLELQKFKTDAASALLTRAYTRPAVVNYNFGGPVFALVAAHEIYGDARQSPIIEQYNSAPLPYMLGPVVAAPTKV